MNTTPRLRPAQFQGLLREFVRQAHGGRGPKIGFQGPEGHGEKIWIFSHRRSEQIIYSFNSRLDGFHDHKQIPFNGKKLKPAKLRKDYWSPMAMIQFPTGQGSVGRSVYQKLRELKHLHEVSWPEEFRHKTPEELTEADFKKIDEKKAKGIDFQPMRSKFQRGLALNAQKTNSIADLAVVLAGQGAGNRVAASEAEEGEKQLVEVTVNWANDQDRNYAETWSKNVSHGLFEAPAYVIEATGEVTSPKAAAST